MKEKPVGELRESFPEQDVPEYQVFLSFNNDEDGIAFREWWAAAGQKAFQRWFVNEYEG